MSGNAEAQTTFIEVDDRLWCRQVQGKEFDPWSSYRLGWQWLQFDLTNIRPSMRVLMDLHDIAGIDDNLETRTRIEAHGRLVDSRVKLFDGEDDSLGYTEARVALRFGGSWKGAEGDERMKRLGGAIWHFDTDLNVEDQRNEPFLEVEVVVPDEAKQDVLAILRNPSDIARARVTIAAELFEWEVQASLIESWHKEYFLPCDKHYRAIFGALDVERSAILPKLTDAADDESPPHEVPAAIGPVFAKPHPTMQRVAFLLQWIACALTVLTLTLILR